MELVQGATPICEGSCRLTSLERQEVWNDCRSCKVRVGSNGNLLWEASVLLGRKKGCVMDTLKFTAMPFGLTNAPAVFMELMSREEYESHVKMIVESLKEEKMYVKFSNNVEAEQRGSYLDVEGVKWVMSRSWPEGADDFVVFYDARSKDLEACLEKRRRLTNRWLSMKNDIASCGSKYLACAKMEVEYKGSSGFMLRPEIPEWKWGKDN
ncbi:hypothetical protein Tco_0712975 [Tanacetum coccineum]